MSDVTTPPAVVAPQAPAAKPKKPAVSAPAASKPASAPAKSTAPAAPAPVKAVAKPRAKVPAKPVVKAKPAVAAKAQPTAEPVVPEKAQPKHQNPAKAVSESGRKTKIKIKMVRDSFTFPETEHKRLVELKRRVIALGTEVKKGEMVRAGLALLAAMDDARLLKAVASVERLKTGRPKK